MEQSHVARNRHFSHAELKVGGHPLYSTRKHAHEALSIGVIDRGGCTVSCKGEDFRLEEGNAVLFPARAVHLCQPVASKVFRFRMLYIDSHWIRQRFGIDASRSRPFSLSLRTDALETLNRLETALVEAEDPFVTESELVEFAGPFLEKADAVAPEDLPRDLASVKTFMEGAFAEPLSLEELSKRAEMNAYRFIRKFQRSFGLTPHAFLLNLRIEQASRLLKEGRVVADVAAECGLCDQSHLVRTFRLYVGMTPNAYRKRSACNFVQAVTDGDA